MSSFGVIGSGFGLYGYLPALCQCGYKVTLPARYMSAFQNRKELTRYSSKIEWGQDEETVLTKSWGVVLALPPKLQSSYIPQIVLRNNISCLLLEKPLADTPETSALHLDSLTKASKMFRINYLFRYTDWVGCVKRSLEMVDDATILAFDWRFMAHHYLRNLSTWKRHSSEGGGVVRFYGIHLISLLAELGYNHVVFSTVFGTSPDEISRWVAILQGSNLPECNLYVDSRSETQRFHVTVSSRNNQDSGHLNIRLNDPFEQATSQVSDEDRRVPFIKNLCESLRSKLADESHLQEVYFSTNRLWRVVEDATKFVPT